MESLNFDHMNVAVVAVEVVNCHRNSSNPESKIAVDHHKKVADVSQVIELRVLVNRTVQQNQRRQRLVDYYYHYRKMK
jgi:hypothetical protein